MTAVTPDIPRDESQEVVVQSASLREWIVKILVKKGMFAVEAEMTADRMVEADLRGIHSHGSRALPRYVQAIDDGNIDPRASTVVVTESPAMAVIDGNKGMGHVASTRAMQLAIKKAKEVGTGTVAVTRGQHYGAASVYVLLAIQEGCIGYSTTSTAYPTVAAYGSKKAAVANNAFAWGVPSRNGSPFVLDMACAEASWGKVETRKLYGLPLPDGWALDAEGKQTNEPEAAKTLLPAAGARGFGLAYMCSVLAGPLVGRRMPIRKKRDPYLEGSEHFFYAIDPTKFGDVEKFYSELGLATAEIRELEPTEGFDKVRLPGELETERAERWMAEGIPIHRDHADALNRLGDTLKIVFA